MSDVTVIDWEGFQALALESERLRLVCIPELGAKIVSLLDKKHSQEWLVSPMRPLKKLFYGAEFTLQDMSGWDEMMPTITACTWNGLAMPDHGEVWSIPWQVKENGNMISLSVASPTLPYRLSRDLALTAPDRLEMRYRLEHTGGGLTLPYIWAAHPQFIADEHTRVILPGEVKKVLNVIENDPLWGEAGTFCTMPLSEGVDGKVYDLTRVRPVENHACRKFYLPPWQAVNWAGLRHERKGCELRLSWPAEEVPYLGLWFDEGAVNNRPVAAPEPSTGYYDSLERAFKNGRVAWLKPGEQKAWTMTVTLSDWPPIR